jgi:hypothetical protein
MYVLNLILEHHSNYSNSKAAFTENILDCVVIFVKLDYELDVNRLINGIAVFDQLKAAVDVILSVIQTQLKKPFNGMSNLEGEHNNIIN